jgi:hypothetical protein
MKANTTSIRSNVVNRAIGALSLLCVYGLSPLPHAEAQTPYVQTGTSANRLGDWTDLSKKDTNPNSLYFVTSNWNPPGNPGVYNNHPTGVWFDSGRKDWAIFNQDDTAIPLGAAFNVIRVPAAENVYVHTATSANSLGDFTLLNNAYTNDNPYALVWVTPNWNPGARGGVYDDHNIGVWYDSYYGRWAIFNQDGSAIPAGASFNVIIGYEADAPYYYTHTATASNSEGDFTILDDSLINGANGHLLMVTPNWNPDGVGGVYDNHAIGVWYYSAIKRYAIFNQDGSAIPAGASFNVWVLK